MHYHLEIFSPWPDDGVQENASVDKNSRRLYENFITTAMLDVNYMIGSLQGLEISRTKSETLLNMYKINHNIFGFAKILKLNKIFHLASISDFAFDFARKENTLTKHSVDYLIRLLLNMQLKLLKDFMAEDSSSEDISLLIEECRLYLSPPLEAMMEKYRIQTSEFERKGFQTLPPEPENGVRETPSAQEKQAEALPREVPKSVLNEKETDVGLNDFSDEPEELNIPADKIGLISDFYEECSENLGKIGNRLIDLESSPDSSEIVNELFRSVHTVKGGARLLKIRKIELLSHSMENLLDLIRNRKIRFAPELIDYLMDGKSLLSELLEETASKGPLRTRILPVLKKIEVSCRTGSPSKTVSEPIKQELIEVQTKERTEELSSVKSELKTSEAPVSRMSKDKQESIRVSIDKLDEVINSASELSLSRIQFREQIGNVNRVIRDIKRTLSNAQENDPGSIIERITKANYVMLSDIRAGLEKYGIHAETEFLNDIVFRFRNELRQELSERELSVQEELTLLLISFQDVKNAMVKNADNLETLTSKLQNEVMNFRMVPIASLFERFPALIRDMARQTGKKVKMNLNGQDTELDRVMINTLADPLIHVLRNSVDHGIESPEERKLKGKSETGEITLSAYYQGSYAIIEIRDDGKGIDFEAVQRKALEKNLADASELKNMSEKEILNFIFHPGFSTSGEITELSGRGVGMDVVMTVIRHLQGSIDLETVPGKGTVFYLKIPLTLAVVRVLLFDVGNQMLAFPMANVEEILTVSKDEIETLGNRYFYHLRSEVIPLIHMADVLSIPHSAVFKEEIPVIILNDGKRKLGMVGDTILGRQEIVIKNLGTVLKKVPFIMGCAILSDRRLVMILNPGEIIEAALNESTEKKATKTISDRKEENREIHSILVVDDSPLQRKNIRSILSRAGWQVDEAENGFEAMKLVRFKKYSLFCIDLVMPLMDGFELVSRLKSLPLYKSIPVIVITAKHSLEDRERGLKVGANEFLEKPVNPEELTELVRKYVTAEKS
ncbi:MAG TPA: response regulator [Leptospiraceae bacterium]|nr:response regulator [Leptospiraceae bacterium]